MELQEVLIQFVLPILTAIIAYLGATNKSKKDLDIVRENNKTEIEKLERISKAEIEKIEKQSKIEIEKLEREIEKQAELYEKNIKTDKIGKVFDQVISGDMSGIENLQKIGKMVNNKNYSARKRR